MDFLYENQNLTGFELFFEGLPMICNFFVSGYTPIPIFNQGDEPIHVSNNDIFQSSYKGKTIGPRKKLLNSGYLEFIENLIFDTDSSYSLKWINEKE